MSDPIREKAEALAGPHDDSCQRAEGDHGCHPVVCGWIERVQAIEAALRERDEVVTVARKWSDRWKRLADWRGWPASRHERVRRESQLRIAEARRQGREERDAEWCRALWPCNPEGVEPHGPADGAEWYRTQIYEAARRGREEMREEAARVAVDAGGMKFLDGASQSAREYAQHRGEIIAVAIRALPLDPPEPEKEQECAKKSH